MSWFRGKRAGRIPICGDPRLRFGLVKCWEAHFFRHGGLCLIACVVLATSTAKSDPIPPAGYVDDAFFREQLRQWGLTDWLEQYYTDTPAPDEIDAQLRRRESLLAEVAEPDVLGYERRAKMAEATEILDALIAKYSEHPFQLRWLFERARDDLERREPGAFEAILLYESTGWDRQRVASLSSTAIETLTLLRQKIERVWESVELMHEDALDAALASGALRLLEVRDCQSTLLLTWAKLYHALSADHDDVQRRAVFSDIFEEVTERSAWTKAGAGQETLRCHGLVLAAVSARCAGRFDEADACARKIIASYTKIADLNERKQLRNASLLAVIEQVRVLRDAGKLDESLNAIEQAKAWAKRSRPDDVRTHLAIAMTERSIRARRVGSRVDFENLLVPTEALEPIRVFAEQSPNGREAVYAMLAGVWGADPPALASRESTLLTAEALFDLQLIAGATLRNVLYELPSEKRKTDTRLVAMIDNMQRAVTSPPESASAAVLGELMYLLSRAYYLQDEQLKSVNVLADLVEKYPKHDRAMKGCWQAVAMAQELFGDRDGLGRPEVRQAFVRVAKLLRRQDPDSPASKQLQYFIGLSLENSGLLRDASSEYAQVPADDANALRAAVRRVRCLRSLFDDAIADQNDTSAVRKLADETVQVAREAVALWTNTQSRQRGQDDPCMAAELVLSLANLLNHPLIGQSADAVGVLDDFEKRFAKCPDALGRALRERILAFRQLKRMGEARQVVVQFLETDSEHAGPVMANLLDAMRDEIHAAADRGDEGSVADIASEAAQLAQMLLVWSDQHAGRLGEVDQLTLHVWRAWSLLHAGQASEAIELYKSCEGQGADVLPAESALRFEMKLGRAECLLALDRCDEAVALFTEVWQQSSEHTRHWWRAYVGSLNAHTRLKHDPKQILQSIQQQRHLVPDLGGPRWRRALEEIEKSNLDRTQPD